MGILEGQRVLVTGVTAPTSIAFTVARLAQAEGATVAISNFGRALAITRRIAARLDPVPPIVELDVTDADHLAALPGALTEAIGGVDSIVHSVAFANPETALGGRFMTTDWDDVATALHVSAYSLVALVRACDTLLHEGSAIVGLTFDGRVSWPGYDWMGVSKAALEAASRYVARYVGARGIRSNLVSAGPIDTLAKQAIPGSSLLDEAWAQYAPLGWDPTDPVPAAKAVVALLSDWFPRTTGEVVHVDGGVHSTGR